MSTSIEWARNPDGSPGESWSPATGCTAASDGCRHCWAKEMAGRMKRMGSAKYDHADPFAVRVHPGELEKPLRWRKPRTVAVNLMGDLFHEDVPFEYIAAVFGVMAACPQHTFIVLSKRDMTPWFDWVSYGRLHYARDPLTHAGFCAAVGGQYGSLASPRGAPWPLPNVFLGCSIEDQPSADARIPDLLRCPAAVHFVSAEPLLAGVLLDDGVQSRLSCSGAPDNDGYCCDTHCVDDEPGHFRGIDWVISGAESGPSRRPCAMRWLTSLRDQCRAAGVPYFCKQAVVDGKVVKMPELGGKVWDQMPDRGQR